MENRSNLILSIVVGVLILLVVVGEAVSAETHPPSTTTINYTPTNDIITNPERGFYRYHEIRSSDPYVLWAPALADYRPNENISLIYCLFLLDEFTATPISADFLTTISDNFAAARTAGVKCVLRFAYTVTPVDTDGDDSPDPPYGDASKAIVLGHVAQLEPILQANADVIAVWQAGFIGIWGEWYYTDHFVDDPENPGVISADNYADRYEVITSQLAAIPTDRMLQVRTPGYKQNMLGDTMPIASATAHNGSEQARIGLYNDCFLASPTDFGTYGDLVADYAWLSAESVYLPVGGETCNDTTDDDPSSDRSECPTALTELALFHWSYLNTQYHPDVLASWVADGCMDEIKRKLGYRFELQQGIYQETVRPGDGFDFELSLENVGYAAPFNPREAYLVISGTNGTFSAELPDDIRFWLADGTTQMLDYTITVPTCVPEGSYELFLSMPDSADSLANRPEYAIRVANANAPWDNTTGMNNLGHTVIVDNNATANRTAGQAGFASDTCVPSAIELSKLTTQSTLPLLFTLLIFLGLAFATKRNVWYG